MIKNVRPVDGIEQLDEGGGRGAFLQGMPCLSILITAPAACVALAPLLHVAIRKSFSEKGHL